LEEPVIVLAFPFRGGEDVQAGYWIDRSLADWFVLLCGSCRRRLGTYLAFGRVMVRSCFVSGLAVWSGKVCRLLHFSGM